MRETRTDDTEVAPPVDENGGTTSVSSGDSAMTTLVHLNGLDRAAFTTALGHLFEHSPWVAEETWSRRPFRDEAHLHAELCSTMRRASPDRQQALINAHPDLAGRLALAGKLTAESAKEQASAGLNQMTTDELARFTELNATYRGRFGFPFIICARLNDRRAIVDAMKQRLTNSPAVEQAAALSEIEKIAWLRLSDLLKPESAEGR